MPVALDICCTPTYAECRCGLPKYISGFGDLTDYYESSCYYGYETPYCGGDVARYYEFTTGVQLRLKPEFDVYKFAAPEQYAYVKVDSFPLLDFGFYHYRRREWYPTRGYSKWTIYVYPYTYHVIDVPKLCIKNWDCEYGSFYADFHIELVLFRFISAEREGLDIRCECYCTDYYDLEVWDFSTNEEYKISLKPGYNEIYLTNCPKIKILKNFTINLDTGCLTIYQDWKWDWAKCGYYKEYEDKFKEKKEAARHYAKYFISDDTDVIWKKFPASKNGEYLTEDMMLFDISNYL